MGARLLAPSSCQGSPRCTIAAAAAAARGISDKSGSSFPARVPTTGERRSLHKTAATTSSPAAAAATRAQDSGSSRRSLNTTARNLGVDPTVRGPKGLLPEFSLKDKVIVVSGGAQGLGLVQTEALLEAGALVHVFDRQPEPGAGSKYAAVAQRAASELDTSVTYHRVDVRDGVAELNGIAREIADRRGRLDGLIAAAGIQQEAPALEYSAADADRMLGVNVTGVLMTAQAVARQMVRLGTPGSIALIASMSGSVANRGLICPVYNASKAAVIQLGRNLAAEWGEHGIRVNTISPGYIVTDMVRALFDRFPEREVEWPRQNMLGKLSAPEDYRGAAVFLLSDASRFMTGADLRIDGGHSAW
ncbi:putative short chain dehydrogenase protein [Eutypa lata UCREL1]|uniref:Putative short chain dehydrogenase protein n=1 Tax=Eutypa lata (strain UCR-EL1) TaxID=1287681 RepID=M7T6R4_EUTLA|nr:putative short chain dehydrogenase protein [Eutypa lata UCREL1]